MGNNLRLVGAGSKGNTSEGEVPGGPVDGDLQSKGLTWQASLKAAIRKPLELLKELSLSPEDVSYSEDGAKEFPLFVTREFVSRMRKGDANDPLFLQVWPRGEESVVSLGFVKDAVGELGAEVLPGLLHKYHGRVLLIASGACAIHCRYCFRRHFPYAEAPKHVEGWDAAISHIRGDESIQEVILSGGDPLSLVDSSLSDLIDRIEAIPHVKRLRIHSRLPVVLPSRVTHELQSILGKTRLGVWFVTHINHANEIDENLAAALQRLQSVGVVLLNQAVLLKGVNDSLEALETLCSRLVDMKILPYYLHQLDRVEGASHWEVDQEIGKDLVRQLRGKLSGYAVPLFVKEESSEPNKTPL